MEIDISVDREAEIRRSLSSGMFWIYEIIPESYGHDLLAMLDEARAEIAAHHALLAEKDTMIAEARRLMQKPIDDWNVYNDGTESEPEWIREYWSWLAHTAEPEEM